MDIKEKQAFEIAFKNKLGAHCCQFDLDKDGNYEDRETLCGWHMWQASKAQAVPEGFVLVKASDRDQEMLELIDQRDHMESQAEQLKDKLQNLYGVDFGEHSNCNFPFQNAINFDDSDLVLVPKNSLKVALSWMDEDIDPWQMGGDSFAELYEHKPILEALIEAQEQKG